MIELRGGNMNNPKFKNNEYDIRQRIDTIWSYIIETNKYIGETRGMVNGLLLRIKDIESEIEQLIKENK